MAEMTRSQRIGAATALAAAIAAPAEGLRQWAYRDPVGIPTVCFGATRGVQLGDHYSVEQCDAMLTRDMREAVATVETCQPALPVQVLAAFGDAVYNLGPSVACDTRRSTAARYLSAGDLAGACEQLPRWNRATIAGISVVLPGLTTRRGAERDLCLQGVA